MGCDQGWPEQPEEGSMLPTVGKSRTELFCRGVGGVVGSYEIGFGHV